MVVAPGPRWTPLGIQDGSQGQWARAWWAKRGRGEVEAQRGKECGWTAFRKTFPKPGFFTLHATGVWASTSLPWDCPVNWNMLSGIQTSPIRCQEQLPSSCDNQNYPGTFQHVPLLARDEAQNSGLLEPFHGSSNSHGNKYLLTG